MRSTIAALTAIVILLIAGMIGSAADTPAVSLAIGIFIGALAGMPTALALSDRRRPAAPPTIIYVEREPDPAPIRYQIVEEIQR